jgi:hypothetical protein
MALPESILQEALKAQYKDAKYHVGVSEEILYGDNLFIQNAQYYGNARKKSVKSNSIHKDFLEHLGITKDWLDEKAAGSVFDATQIADTESDVSLTDTLTIPANSIITGLVKTEDGIEVTFVPREEMEMARKLVDTSTN